MKRYKLAVEKRKILGKQIKKLRREGILPGNIFGKNIKSTSVQIPLKEFSAVYKETGETGLVDLELDGKIIPVLIQNLQSDYKNNILHANFYQVNLKEKVKAAIPLEIIREPIAVTEKLGLLINILSEIEVEALPEDLPENIEVNVEHLAAVDEQITVADLKAPAGVEILTDATQVVAKIDELISKEAQELAAEEAAAAEAAKAEAGAVEGAEGAPAEGEVPAEGEAPKEGGEKPSEEKPATEAPKK
ncbi:MAG: 50S ribosomal protein L25 [Patescibacteria group bacterium]|nr:50S ribosomal protein L25 [Patescibacteria group bacterium]